VKSVFNALIIIVFGMASLRAVAQTNTLKVATQARFDLNGDAASGALTNGYATQGDASVDRQTWLSAAEQPRSFTINYTVSHFGWMPATFRFTPASNGVVTLTIRGPWEMGTNGLIWKQEVLWDSLSATGASLPNGSFESVSSGVPAGWYRTYGVDATTDTGPVTPVSGNRYARVWHDGPLSVSLTVTGGVPVILKFFARASFSA